MPTVMADARKRYIAERLQSGAEELVARGAIGVAARISFPNESGDLVIAAGHRERERQCVLDGTELFAIASQSKMFTAAAILLLIRSGDLKLSDPVSRYVPDVPAVDKSATIEQFLNHTSGIGNFIHALTVLPHPWPRMSYEDLMALARMHGQQFAPGARLEYNNTDVVVLARIVELLSGQSLAEFLARGIFSPLGMRDTYVAVPGATIPRERMAKGYYIPSCGFDGPPVDVALLEDYSIASAAGNIVSSLADLCRWARSLADGPNEVGLSLSDFVASVADQGAQVGHWFFPHTYGRGVEGWSWSGRSVWGHRGSFFGYHSGTFIEPLSGAAFSMAMTMCTSGSFMNFIDIQGHDYMSFMQVCCQYAVDAVQLP
jgi:CubicO group peptidase (beta-lactamase class C family)